jgi:hypothetical protein
MKKIASVTTVLMLLLNPLAHSAKPAPDTQVISVLNDVADPVNGTLYDIRSDGHGSYASTTDGSVLSIFQGYGGDWEFSTLGTRQAPTRFVTFNFSDPVTPGTIPPFGTLAVAPTRFIVKCGVEGVSIPAMTQGQQVACLMATTLLVSGTTYKIGMGGDTGTDKVLVTCVGASGGKCVQWSITTLVPGSKNLGRLYRTGKAGALEPLGEFRFSLSFKVALPGYLTTT